MLTNTLSPKEIIQKTILLLLALFATMADYAQETSRYDMNKPFGWAVCSSLTKVDANVTGGKGGKKIVLQSDGNDMRDKLIEAINNYDIIVLDGEGGEFVVSSVMRFKDLANKTIVGINYARITTKFKLTTDLHKILDDKHVLDMPSSSDGKVHKLSNGNHVKEVREWAVRQAIIDTTGDQQEQFREAGLFHFNNISNVIIRNLTLRGPGAVDVGGSDLMTLSGGSKNVWVDHCEFIDGMDGNFDINSFSDFITISWCKFRYTSNTYDHANTNLVGSNDKAEMNGIDNLNITYAFCNWDEGCNQRMPMARFGTIHLLNNLYTCDNCSLAVNPRKDSEVRLEGCVFTYGVQNVFKADDAKAYQFKDNIIESDFKLPPSLGTVSIPYAYNSIPVLKVKAEVGTFVGATLTNPL